jgi:translation initiation factor IF-1
VTENPRTSGVVLAALPPGFTYRVRLADGREILCGVSRGYFPDSPYVPKKLRPVVGDEVLVELRERGAIQGFLVRA